MIIGGISNSGKGLGQYLTTAENEHAEVWELQSARRDLVKAVDDWRAYANGTKAEKPIYHAWLRPSDTDRVLSREDWDKAINLFEKEMGFEGQPRAVIYHHGEGQGEQGHIHLVYSRIKDGKAISDSWNYVHHEKARAEIEKELNLEHVYSPHLDRDEPRRAQGLDENAKEQGKRLKVDPKEVKAEVSELYKSADSGRAFVAGMEEAGYTLAQGDKRGYVIVDQAGGPHSLSRILNGTAKADEMRDRLKEYPLENLPTVDKVREQREQERQHQAARPELDTEQPAMVQGLGNASPMPEIPAPATPEREPQKQETGRRGRNTEAKAAPVIEARAVEIEAHAPTGHAPERDGVKSAASVGEGLADAGLKVAAQALEVVGGIVEGLLGGGPSGPPLTPEQAAMVQEIRDEAAEAKAEREAAKQAKVARYLQMMNDSERQHQEERERNGGRGGRQRER